jgi:hypothetical protein
MAIEKKLSKTFGALIGAMWVGEVVLGNLGGTAVLGNLRDFHPHVYALAPWFALGAVGMTAMGGFVAAYRTLSIISALRVGLWSGLLSGSIALVTISTVVVLFHDAMMNDPSNVHEFTNGAHRLPSEGELSRFIYTDGFAGGLNHLWIGPLLGITVGGIGALMGKAVRRSDEAAKQVGRSV